jgi:hypothetical protein
MLYRSVLYPSAPVIITLALLAERSRVKCPLPDIELASTAKKAQFAMALEPAMDAMDRFVTRDNIERYRKLASETTDPTERSRIMKFLADEVTKIKLELRRRATLPKDDHPSTRRPRSGSSMTERSNELKCNTIGARALDLNQCSVQLAGETDHCFAR